MRFITKAMKWKDKLRGGRADKKKPWDFDPKQVAAGRKIEREHTDNKHLQTEITIDHLKEDPDYNKKLPIMERLKLWQLKQAERKAKKKKGKGKKK